MIIDNDFSGDPDDLYQLAHQVLSRSTSVRLVIGSHLSPDDVMDPSSQQATNAARIARELLGMLGAGIPVVAGEQRAIRPGEPPESGAAEAIVAEAMDDDGTPLFYLAGGGLTDLAHALRLEPRIADRITLVWIGGPGYRDAPPSGRVEYNLAIDVDAAAELFDSDVPLWQIPRPAYRQCLVSAEEIEQRVRPMGELGAHLAAAIDAVRLLQPEDQRAAETYCLGDNPLTLVTALQSFYGADASSTEWSLQPARRILPDGAYGEELDRRPIRVAERLDTRLMLEDLFLKLRRHAASTTGAQL